MQLKRREKYVPYLFVLPFIVSFIIFFLIPSVYSLVLSFAKYSGYGAIKWVQFKNYENILKYSRFWEALARTGFYWVCKFVPVTILGFACALAIHSKLLGRSSKIYKPILFLPQICATVATALVFQVILAKNAGVVNQLLGTEFPFIDGKALSKWSVLLMMVWRAVGWNMVVYLSGLSTISDEIDDAARIDGCGAWQKTLYVTIPMMRQTFTFAFIMDAINSLRMYTEAAVLTGTQNLATTNSEGIINLLMMNIKGGNFGMASAYGWITFLLIFIVSMALLKILQERGE